MQAQIRVCFHLRSIKVSVSENMKKQEALSTTGEKVEWYSTYEPYSSSVLKLKAELTHDLAILILGVYSRGLKAV